MESAAIAIVASRKKRLGFMTVLVLVPPHRGRENHLRVYQVAEGASTNSCAPGSKRRRSACFGSATARLEPDVERRPRQQHQEPPHAHFGSDAVDREEHEHER